VCTSTARASARRSHIVSHRGDSDMSSSTRESTPRCTWYASQDAPASRQRRVVKHVAIRSKYYMNSVWSVLSIRKWIVVLGHLS
jgi:hypothetical protein